MLSQILNTVTYNAYSGGAGVSDGIAATFMGMFAAMMFPLIAIIIVGIVAMWKVFEKPGYEGWKAIIPFYNMYIITEISGQNGWLFLINFIPVGSLIWSIMVAIKLAPAFGKSTGFAIGLILFAPIFYCILGFGSAQYTLSKTGTDHSSSTKPKAHTPQA